MKSINMNSYLIESLAPLVFRSGKPFSSQAAIGDVIFPLPSAGAGLIRALYAEQANLAFDRVSHQQLLTMPSLGVLLVRYTSDDKANNSNISYDILVPKPANVIYLKDTEDKEQLVRLVPKPFADGVYTDLPSGLLPVQIVGELNKGKPQKGATYWRLTDVLAWQRNEKLDFTHIKNTGLGSLPIEQRTHVAIDDITFGSETGKLFQTASFDLNHPKHGNVWQKSRLGFMVCSEIQLNDTLATFGGERRLSNVQKLPSHPELTAPTDLAQHINEAKGFCLTFLSPAIFANGYLPSWLDKDSKEGVLPQTTIKVRLTAVAIDRWQAVSGWDSLDWQPKAMRKAVASGSVYWFEIIEGTFSQVDIEKYYFQALSDNEQDRLDGFGLLLMTPFKP